MPAIPSVGRLMESRDLSGLHFPPVGSEIDFQVRKASPIDASAVAHVYVASWRSTYGALLPAAKIGRAHV